MSEKNNFCYLCGDSCYGSTCDDCYRKGKYNSIARMDARRRQYVKQVQHSI